MDRLPRRLCANGCRSPRVRADAGRAADTVERSFVEPPRAGSHVRSIGALGATLVVRDVHGSARQRVSRIYCYC